MGRLNKHLIEIRGDYGDLLLCNSMYQDVFFVNNKDDLIIHHLTAALELLEKQNQYVDIEEAPIAYITVDTLVSQSVRNALDLMAIKNGQCISKCVHMYPPSQKEMDDFLKKWRKRKSTF